MSAAKLPIDPVATAIRVALTTICQAGDVYELRVPNAGPQRTISGYFDDVDLMAQAAKKLSGNHPGIYVTANPVNPALRARASNRVIGHAQSTTADHDITRRHWLPVDLDPQRPAGISATTVEHAEALERAREIDAYLRGQGWTAPLIVDTGNGYCLLYPIHLPNDEKGRNLVKRCLEALGFDFDDGHVHVDQAMFNAARLVRIPGTLNAKGDSTPDRPHRRATVVRAPGAEPVATELLEKLAASVVNEPSPSKNGRRPSSPFELQDFITTHELDVRRVAGYQNGTRWLLATCPLHAEAVQGSSCAVIRWPSGTIIFKCQHNRCAGKTWQDLRAQFAPDHRQQQSQGIHAAKGEQERSPNIPDNPEGGGRPVGILLSDVKAEPISWFWPQRIAKGKVTLIDGDPGLGKSVLTIDMAARVTMGRAWPDGAPCPTAGVVILSAEDGLADTIRPRLDAAGGDPARVLAVQVAGADDHELMIPADLTEVGRAIERVSAGLVIVDPLMAYLGSETNSHRDQDVRRALRPLAELAERTGVAVVVVRHLNKAVGGPAMYRGGGSIGIIGAARIALVVGMDPEDQGRRVLAVVKTNIGPNPPALAYRLTEAANGTVKLVWEERECSLTAAQLLAAPVDAKERSALDDAEDFLRALLCHGPVEVPVINRTAREEGISQATLRRARGRLGIKVNDRTGFGAGHPSRWSLPDLPAQTAPYLLNQTAWTSSGVDEQVGRVADAQDVFEEIL